MSGKPDDMPESALELPGMDLTQEYRDRAEELGESDVSGPGLVTPMAGASDDFNRLVDWIQSELQIQSTRITFPGPPLAHFHVSLDREEYIIAVVPTKLAAEP